MFFWIYFPGLRRRMFVEQDRQTFASNYTFALAIVAARHSPNFAKSHRAFMETRICPAIFYLAMLFGKDARFAILVNHGATAFFQNCDVSGIINVDHVIAEKENAPR